jgi:hypothetical protein
MEGCREVSGVKSRVLAISDLQEGDILVMFMPSLVASLICCCGCSWGSSHVGQVMRLDGQLWLAESTPFSLIPRLNFSQWVRPGAGPVHGGVCATAISDSFTYYTAIDIYRPVGVTRNSLDTMRNEFLRLYGTQYKRLLYEVAMKCVVCIGRDLSDAVSSGYDCADLTFHLFGMIGHVGSDLNVRLFGYDVVRPYDIPRLIACDRLGHADGAYSIGDPRSFLHTKDRRVNSVWTIQPVALSSAMDVPRTPRPSVR